MNSVFLIPVADSRFPAGSDGVEAWGVAGVAELQATKSACLRVSPGGVVTVYLSA